MSGAAPEGVINTYGGIDELKSRMSMAGVSADNSLWMALHSASRAIDAHCNRRFYSLHATRLFDVDHPAGFVVPDLISVVALREDADRDRVFEVEWDDDDYILYPLNSEPESAYGRPYAKVVADAYGVRPSFTCGRSAVQVEGFWGYRSDLADSGAGLAEGGPLAVDDTSVTVTDGTKLAAGQTAQIESEQMFVRAVSGNTLTVARGVNGTTAVAHVDGLDVSVFRYPPQIVEAALLMAARSWKRKDTPYGPTAGAHGFGEVIVATGVDPDVARLLSPFRRMALGVAV